MNNLTDITHTHTHTNMFSFEKLRCFRTEPRKATFRPKAKIKNVSIVIFINRSRIIVLSTPFKRISNK